MQNRESQYISTVISPEIEADIQERLQQEREQLLDYMRSHGTLAPGAELSPEQEAEIQKTLTKFRNDLIQLYEKEQITRSAAATPFPGPLRKAFASGPTRVLGYTLQPVTLALVSALERLDLRFVDMVEIIVASREKSGVEIAKEIEKQLHLTIDEQVAAIYVFTTPRATLEAELKKGKGHVIEHAREMIGAKHHLRDLGKLNSALIAHYVESFSTHVAFEAAQGESDGSFLSASPTKTEMVGA